MLLLMCSFGSFKHLHDLSISRLTVYVRARSQHVQTARMSDGTMSLQTIGSVGFKDGKHTEPAPNAKACFCQHPKLVAAIIATIRKHPPPDRFRFGMRIFDAIAKTLLSHLQLGNK